MKRVREVMSHYVFTVREDATFKEVALVLHRNHVSGVPVVDDAGKLVGVVSEGDLILKEEHAANGKLTGSQWRGRFRSETEPPWWFRRRKAGATVARDLMTSPAISIQPEATTGEAAKIMRQDRVRRLPVLDADGSLVGIVTRADLVRTFLRSDMLIREDIETALVQPRRSVEPGQLIVTVAGGVATVEGTVGSRSQIGPILQIVAAVPGVVDVVSHVGFRIDDVGSTDAGDARPIVRRFRDTWRSPVG
jgi:CBS domain-containing protein